jgi:hypothetical protein
VSFELFSLIKTPLSLQDEAVPDNVKKNEVFEMINSTAVKLEPSSVSVTQY